MDTGSSIFVAGHRGLVGSAILRKLKDKGFHNLIVKSRNELDLIDEFFFDFDKKEFWESVEWPGFY